MEMVAHFAILAGCNIAKKVIRVIGDAWSLLFGEDTNDQCVERERGAPGASSTFP
jgi:hypothetical protein